MEITTTTVAEQTGQQNKNTENVPTISMRSGNTTFIIGLHFNKNCKETLKNKAKRMIRADVAAGNV